MQARPEWRRSTRSSRVPIRKVRHACWLPPSESEVGSFLRFTATPVAVPALRPIGAPRLAIDRRKQRGTEEEVDQLRIELRPPPFGDRPGCLLEAFGMAVTAPVGNSVEAVGDRDD